MVKFLKKKAFPAIPATAPKTSRGANIKPIDAGSIDTSCNLETLKTA